MIKTNSFSCYQVDAFAERIFEGNPAAVVPLDFWLDNEVMQKIAKENNLSETAFFIPINADDNEYQLRWFTPEVEVNLCGHATLASAYVLFNLLEIQGDYIRFQSRSGMLEVRRKGELYWLNFPSMSYDEATVDSNIVEAMGIAPSKVYTSDDDWLLLYDTEEQVKSLKPDMSLLREFPARGIIATSSAENYDAISRFFAPSVGIDEDYVTGSSFTKLIPFWSEKLEKDELYFYQASARGGVIFGKNMGDRVEIGGKAKLFSKGKFYINGEE
ncbi:PhzF family phenazine biosynthesis protein [Marinigracilibium pacificum]|uniref:PhzF family phenazine biosynthesis protein n=1 Tax=Marinigracilibium pacificum TaxID=2729599 RepID=A0A848JAS6_9BACT|nr:PhzF family phenazine biosynthesis protein [Marinigracilibium pacificum]NMM50142.1 PhzF family phenazine biosynthesis protein [Marinigracilibium pacificum]